MKTEQTIRLPASPPLSSSDLFGCLWHWRTRLPERKGQPCRVLVRGGMNSVLVEFTDGQKVVTSRYAIRKQPNDPAQAGRGNDVWLPTET
jgi:hypothetical protein